MDAENLTSDPTEISETEAENTAAPARHSSFGQCLFCDGGTHVHFDAAGIVVACSKCKGQIRFSGGVLNPPDVDQCREKTGTRYELGLIGKANYARLTGTRVIPGRIVAPKDPTDAESDADLDAARTGKTPNAVARSKAPAKGKGGK